MGTLLGIVVGILATILVAHFYYRRAYDRKLKVYILFSNRIFSGIDDPVRSMLKFTFKDLEVQDIQQIDLIVANAGQRAISNYIQPLTLRLPEHTSILDATMLYRSPKDLVATIKQSPPGANNTTVVFEFPLLNKGDFFLTKLLLNGSVSNKELNFTITADDLPRTIRPQPLPYRSTLKKRQMVEWEALIVGLTFLLITFSFGYALYLLFGAKPELFPFPWKTFQLSVLTVTLLVTWLITGLTFFILGLAFTFGLAFEQVYKWGPRFPLPDDFRQRGMPVEVIKVVEQETKNEP